MDDLTELQRLADDGNPYPPPDPPGPVTDCRACLGWGCNNCLWSDPDTHD